jgi:hypothetical protein
MNCSRILDMVYEYSGESGESSMPLYIQFQIWLHTLVCPDCAQEIERFEVARNILSEDFFPVSPGIENSIMAKIENEPDFAREKEPYVIPAGLPTRGWVIAGIIILVSLATVFFGLDFKSIKAESGISFLLPVGITIGTVLTVYGALFIGSHLKELSERFGL